MGNVDNLISALNKMDEMNRQPLENHLIAQFNDLGYHVQKTDGGYLVSKGEEVHPLQPNLDNLNGLLLKIQEGLLP